jgi:hypothetical protein
MSDVQTFTEGQPAPAAEATPAATPAVETPSTPTDNRERPALEKSPSQSLRDAARALANRRKEIRDQAAAAAQPPAAPTATQSSPEASDAAQPETGPGDPSEADPAAVELAPIEPPKGWKKEYKAAFEALPRNVQEQVAESERTREADYLRRQNEVVERQRAFEVELQQMQQTRQQYQSGLDQALQMTLTNNEFQDIRSMEDVEAMAQNDWPRWVRYQTHQQKVGMLQQQLQEVRQQNYQEQVGQWARFAEEQDTRFSEKFPDAKELKDAAVGYLKEQGFETNEIARYWNSAAWRDARMQGIILDAVRYHKAKAKADAAKRAPVPEVQKPGVSAPKANPFQAEIAELEGKGGLSLREATKLHSLRRLASAKK